MNCKSGDIAVIVHSPLQMNLGKLVDVVTLMGNHSEFGPIWRIRAKGRSLVTDLGIVCAACDIPDAWLRPIRGEPTAEDTPADADLPQPVGV